MEEMTDKELFWSKVKWYIKQLLPLPYYAEYESDKVKYNCRWWMWLGYSFWIRHTEES